jgi:alpha-tubulin suppressor-like RCC1 family protein
MSSSTPVAVSGGLSFAAIAVGDLYTCGVTSSGTAYCWGNNEAGQLGNGSIAHSTPAPVAVSGGLTFTALAAGSWHTCGLTGSGAAYCWGNNGWGRLGDGSTTSSTTPVVVSGGLVFAALALGEYHTCGLVGSGAAYCWGSNSLGQLGNGSTTDASSPVPVSGGLTFTAIAVGTYPGHTCALAGSGATYCWGYNGLGQLGNGAHTQRQPPSVVSGGIIFSALDAGQSHTCGLTSSGTVYCWGDNSSGQLGRGTFGYSAVPVAVVPF